jgi:phosphoribosyl-dephospho-CoA transferase
MKRWQRNRLVRLRPAGWAKLPAQVPASNQAALACVDWWQQQNLPLVIVRQVGLIAADGAAALALGLPTPSCWGRQRLRFEVDVAEVLEVVDFPAAEAVSPLLATELRAGWTGLCRQLASASVAARVYGSFGWQQLSGCVYLRPQSDLDLLLPVAAPPVADIACALLLAADATSGLPRLDGELMFADGSAVAWREWAAWRAGASAQILVKRLHGVSLESGTAWLERATAVETEAVTA